MNKNRTEVYETMAVFLNPLNNSSSKPGRSSQPEFCFLSSFKIEIVGGREETVLGNQNLSDYDVFLVLKYFLRQILFISNV